MAPSPLSTATRRFLTRLIRTRWVGRGGSPSMRADWPRFWALIRHPEVAGELSLYLSAGCSTRTQLAAMLELGARAYATAGCRERLLRLGLTPPDERHRGALHRIWRDAELQRTHDVEEDCPTDPMRWVLATAVPLGATPSARRAARTQARLRIARVRIHRIALGYEEPRAVLTSLSHLARIRPRDPRVRHLLNWAIMGATGFRVWAEAAWVRAADPTPLASSVADSIAARLTTLVDAPLPDDDAPHPLEFIADVHTAVALLRAQTDPGAAARVDGVLATLLVDHPVTAPTASSSRAAGSVPAPAPGRMALGHGLRISEARRSLQEAAARSLVTDGPRCHAHLSHWIAWLGDAQRSSRRTAAVQLVVSALLYPGLPARAHATAAAALAAAISIITDPECPVPFGIAALDGGLRFPRTIAVPSDPRLLANLGTAVAYATEARPADIAAICALPGPLVRAVIMALVRAAHHPRVESVGEWVAERVTPTAVGQLAPTDLVHLLGHPVASWRALGMALSAFATASDAAAA